MHIKHKFHFGNGRVVWSHLQHDQITICNLSVALPRLVRLDCNNHGFRCGRKLPDGAARHTGSDVASAAKPGGPVRQARLSRGRRDDHFALNRLRSDARGIAPRPAIQPITNTQGTAADTQELVDKMPVPPNQIGGHGTLNCVRRCPTFPPGLGSIIGAGRLSFRVRDGSGRFPAAMDRRNSILFFLVVLFGGGVQLV